jgi:hypothetical protein
MAKKKSPKKRVKRAEEWRAIVVPYNPRGPIDYWHRLDALIPPSDGVMHLETSESLDEFDEVLAGEVQDQRLHTFEKLMFLDLFVPVNWWSERIRILFDEARSRLEQGLKNVLARAAKKSDEHARVA